MNIQIIDYRMGNVYSVQNALLFLGYQSVVVRDSSNFKQADVIILPGVGSFGDGMRALTDQGLVEPLRHLLFQDCRLIGICLGMQLLLDKSYEMGVHKGLGIVAGEVVAFQPQSRLLKVPHMGWNTIEIVKEDMFFKNIPSQAYCYFVHSYYIRPADQSVIVAKTDYGGYFCSVVKQKNIYGLQFHPEKSQTVGLQILKNLLSFKK